MGVSIRFGVRWCAGVAGVCAFFGSVLLSGADAGAQTPVRVATWNIETVGTPGTEEYAMTLAILDRIQADVVGIQEVLGSPDVPNLMALAADAGYGYVVVPDSNPLGPMRNAFISRLPVIDATIHTSASLSGDPSANDMTRLLVEVVLDVPGDAIDLVLVTQHWKSGTAVRDRFRRSIESYRIGQVVGDLDPWSDAYVVMGDVNEQVFDMPDELRFFTSVPTGLPQSFSVGPDVLAQLQTAPGFPDDPFYYLTRVDGPGMAVLGATQPNGDAGTRPASGRVIDYIFVSASILDLGPAAEVYDSAQDGPDVGLPKFGGLPPADASFLASDHFLVFADIAVPAAALDCPADLAPPFGVLDIFDVLEFLSLFEGGDPRADFAPPFGVLDIFDVIEFLTLFEQGCP